MEIKKGDHLFKVIGALGGINKKQAIDQWGLDPATKIGSIPGYPVLRAGDKGLDLDRMNELLIQYDFIDPENQSDFEDRFYSELAGKRQFALSNDSYENDEHWNKVCFGELATSLIDTDLLIKNLYARSNEIAGIMIDAVKAGLCPDDIAGKMVETVHNSLLEVNHG